VQYHAAVRIAFTVPRRAFEPEPAVDSAVVVLEPLDPRGEHPRLSAEDEGDLWRLVQAGFHERRKMLHNVLVRSLAMPATAVNRALESCGIDGERRPQTLTVDDWLALRAVLAPLPPERDRGAEARR
jgi:16S rRNA (adenine1518-N6/adenine1519-N6)-dimethyltransferase